MSDHRPGQRPEYARFPRLAALRWAAASALVLGTVAFSAGSAAAQSDEDAGTYESPTFGYTLEWDADVWVVDDEIESSTSNGERDQLALSTSEGGDILYVEGSEESWSDTDDCVATLYEEVETDPADGEPLDTEDGDPFELSEDGHSRNAVVTELETDEGDTLEVATLVDCYADPDGDLIVGFTHQSISGPDYADAGYPLIQPIIESLPFAEGSGSGGGEEEEATPEATPEDEEEGGSGSGGGSGTGGGSGDGGVDGNVYTSPTYGFELEFDEDAWTVEDESSEDDVDTLVLEADLLVATVSGFTGPSDLDDCIDYYVDVLNERGENANLAINADDEPAIFTTDDESRIGAFYFYDDENGDPVFVDFYCFPLEDDAYMGIDFAGVQEDFSEDEVGDLIDGILDGITLP